MCSEAEKSRRQAPRCANSRPGARLITVDERSEGQRLDNFVLRECPSIPRTRLYRAMRKGEIRVNKGRVKPDRRLHRGDTVRLPPLDSVTRRPPAPAPGHWRERLAAAVVHEDEHLLALNKPCGMSVHGGSGLQFGLIETLRAMRPEARFLELVHRLDRETSGLILVAKRAPVLRAMHALLREEGGIHKRYVALVAGRWPEYLSLVEAPLRRFERPSGERVVRVSREGKPSRTRFRALKTYSGCSLVEAEPLTGRTHQIRVHAQHAGCPLLGDGKYYTAKSGAKAKALGLRRLFLHASRLDFRLEHRAYQLCAPLDAELESALVKASALQAPSQ